MKSLDIVTFGEAMALFIADQIGELHQVEHFTRNLAGAETNVAIGLSRLGYQVGWVSKVGNDPFGKYIVETLKNEQVDTSQVSVDANHPTGFQLKSKVVTGDPQVQYFRKGSAASHISTGDFSAPYFTAARHMHMTGIPPALSRTACAFAQHALSVMKAAGKTISFDPNLRPQLWSSREEMIRIIQSLAVQADWVLPGISEGEILTGYSQPRDIAAFFLDKGVKLVAIKLGPQGAYFRTADEEQEVAGYPVEKVIDTVGAGDGFAVGLISGMMDGLSTAEAVLRGNAIGALAVMSPGDMDGLPTRDRLTEFMRQCRKNDQES
ncbi:sugar kinase [Paenactinomyces guangxiensis]|uniref:Sugar kinase n=1 Tax=Paenactinomyces guangxiensis TaxID=1490290 RepID=A0A7W2A6B5_9BACL|nr:sugar kinase [Paenactinomyces guangxiensis]MBA4493186.1 sugar kinase [Paenactinomyces guangxiensis]MBH8589964.1 sugar kinase [Paenactinomyces guangxiensis]